MAENRFPFPSNAGARETVCIETNRVMDSCRDRDCFENVRVYLPDFGTEFSERMGAIRAKSAEILWTRIGIDPIAFNRGFYTITVRFFIKVVCEVCGGPSPRGQEIEGISVLEKRVVLFGGDNGTSIFRSSADEDGGFCGGRPTFGEKNLPTAVVEVADPVLLGSRIVERPPVCCCGPRESDLPEAVLASLGAMPVFDDDERRPDGQPRRFLAVSIGLFSVTRIVRPGQYLVSATEYSIPEKECRPNDEENPCSVFRNMPFPIGEFGAQGTVPPPERGNRCGCGGS